MENSVNVNLETDVVTGETLAHFVTSILEFLLYQRNQIPFVCKTFKYLISKWKNNDTNEDVVPSNFQLERQKDMAKQTLDCIKLMGEVISRGFQQSDITRVRFLFGSTAILPKEAYTIVVPSISRTHSYEHHKLQTHVLNQALISLLTSDCLYNTFSTNLCPTNVFLELKMPDHDANGWEQVFSTDLCELPSSCKHIVINLIHVMPADYVQTNCCKDLMIFEDFANLSVEKKSSEKMDSTTQQNTTPQVGWWEASTIVRGFKQTAVKGNTIWQ
ncbi:uncharacterized protein LOC129915374 [Episyrphus balteatus]|uniref:uncharacterized protein LOC129915374 n=1 Tax=Episyrphus balteatus TaxID=286459 RepID=UPI002485F22A|nr:uncharacterized protein LOC129915374 [Episyrphus balteatus]